LAVLHEIGPKLFALHLPRCDDLVIAKDDGIGEGAGGDQPKASCWDGQREHSAKFAENRVLHRP
jgi:hypothetical protein